MIRALVSFLFLSVYLSSHAQDTTYDKTLGLKRFSVGKKTNGAYNGEVCTYDGSRLIWKTDYVKGRKEGREITYHTDSSNAPDGYSICNYRYDIREGPYIWFYQNGTIRQIGQFLNDRYCGIWFSFEENGKLWKVSEEHCGTEAEHRTYFFLDGRIYATGLTIHNVRTGLWLTFDSTYTSFAIGNYMMDSTINERPKVDTSTTSHNDYYFWPVTYFNKKVGIWKTYNLKGDLIRKENYDVEERKK